MAGGTPRSLLRAGSSRGNWLLRFGVSQSCWTRSTQDKMYYNPRRNTRLTSRGHLVLQGVQRSGRSSISLASFPVSSLVAQEGGSPDSPLTQVIALHTFSGGGGFLIHLPSRQGGLQGPRPGSFPLSGQPRVFLTSPSPMEGSPPRGGRSQADSWHPGVDRHLN